jgi:release factor glutamine methyltransferase
MTIREALAEGGEPLAAGGIETSGLDASLLLAEILNTSRSSLVAAGPQPLTEESFAAFNNMLKRRLAGECVAYIIGRKEFYGLEFEVNPSVLGPRPETGLLVEIAIKGVGSGEWGVGNIDHIQGKVVDLCTGSGAVAIALKHELPELEVYATDISPDALAVAAANASRLLPPGSITFYQGDLCEAPPRCAGLDKSSPPVIQAADFKVRRNRSPLPRQHPLSGRPFPVTHSPLPTPHSLILSNPPYIPTAEIASLSPEVRREPTLALDGGNDGLNLIRKIISSAPLYLEPGGVLLLEADPRQMHIISALLDQAGFIDVQIHKDLSGRERVIGGRKP